METGARFRVETQGVRLKPTSAGRLSKLGTMFKDPNVHRQMVEISENWKTSQLIRRGGIHNAIRHAMGEKLFSSHPNDEIRASRRRRAQDTSPNTGANPGHFESPYHAAYQGAYDAQMDSI